MGDLERAEGYASNVMGSGNASPNEEALADAVRALVDHLRSEEQKSNAALVRERAAIAAKAREYAEHYPHGSDGRNTFILHAEWVEARNTTE